MIAPKIRPLNMKNPAIASNHLNNVLYFSLSALLIEWLTMLVYTKSMLLSMNRLRSSPLSIPCESNAISVNCWILRSRDFFVLVERSSLIFSWFPFATKTVWKRKSPPMQRKNSEFHGTNAKTVLAGSNRTNIYQSVRLGHNERLLRPILGTTVWPDE